MGGGGGLRGTCHTKTGNPCCVVWVVWPGDPSTGCEGGFPSHTPQTTQHGFPVSIYDLPRSPPPSHKWEVSLQDAPIL